MNRIENWNIKFDDVVEIKVQIELIKNELQHIRTRHMNNSIGLQIEDCIDKIYVIIDGVKRKRHLN